jgi:hypothetical protein
MFNRKQAIFNGFDGVRCVTPYNTAGYDWKDDGNP